MMFEFAIILFLVYEKKLKGSAFSIFIGDSGIFNYFIVNMVDNSYK